LDVENNKDLIPDTLYKSPRYMESVGQTKADSNFGNMQNVSKLIQKSEVKLLTIP